MSVPTSTIYGREASKLHPETRKQLNDPNYQRIILPEELEQVIESKKGTFVYFFSPTCGHCKRTTPVISKIINDMQIDVKQYNLLEFKDGWKKYNITATPTIVYFTNGKEQERLVGGIAPEGSIRGNNELVFREFFTKHAKGH